MISIVIPFYNEEGNIERIISAVISQLDVIGDIEIVAVDDGSTDNTLEELLDVKTQYQDKVEMKIVELRKNFGQTPALMAGFNSSSGDPIISIDGDFQNDPEDIPNLLAKFNEGYDVVCGWRADRKDPIGKRIPSKIFNYLNRRWHKVPIHDSGCTFRIYSAEAVKNLNLIAEGHRHIPAILSYMGFKITEIKVSHHPRVTGNTKYNMSRLFRGFMDLISLKLFYDYRSRPFQLFVKIGLPIILLAFVYSSILLYQRIFLGLSLSERPGFYVSLISVLIGVQIIMVGFIAELFEREYVKATDRYNIRKVH